MGSASKMGAVLVCASHHKQRQNTRFRTIFHIITAFHIAAPAAPRSCFGGRREPALVVGNR
jgi:hypothetical protein